MLLSFGLSRGNHLAGAARLSSVLGSVLIICGVIFCACTQLGARYRLQLSTAALFLALAELGGWLYYFRVFGVWVLPARTLGGIIGLVLLVLAVRHCCLEYGCLTVARFARACLFVSGCTIYWFLCGSVAREFELKLLTSALLVIMLVFSTLQNMLIIFLFNRVRRALSVSPSIESVFS